VLRQPRFAPSPPTRDRSAGARWYITRVDNQAEDSIRLNLYFSQPADSTCNRPNRLVEQGSATQPL